MILLVSNGVDPVQLVGLAERDGSLHFTAPAVDRLLSLTARHPLYTQLMCQLLFDRAYTASPPDSPTVDVADIDAVIPKALEAGEHFFEWVWGGLPPAERVIFSAVAGATIEKPLITEDELASILQRHGIRILIRELELAPKTLIDWEMLRRTDGGYSFFIELMRRWVAERKPLPKVKDELDRVNPIAEQQYQLGHTFYRLGQLKEAIAPLQAALQGNPNHLKARLLLGEALREQGEVDAAVQKLEEAFCYDSDAARYPLVRALLAQGEMVEKAGREDDALSIYSRVDEISPNERVTRDRRQAIFIARGDRSLQANDFDGAIAAYREVGADQKVAAVLGVQRKRALEASAAEVESLLQREEMDKAAEVYRRLIELDPEDKRWSAGLARVEQERVIARRYAEGLGAMQQSKWAEAQRAFADVVYYRPDFKEAAERVAAATRQAKAERERLKAQEAVTSSSGTVRSLLRSRNLPWSTGWSLALWIRWVVATTVSWALAWPVGVWIIQPKDNYVIFAVIGPLIGGLSGTAQSFILRPHVPRAAWWVVASIVGGAPSCFLGALIDKGFFVGIVLVVVLIGGLSGTAQSFVLRPHVPRAGWWVVASIVGVAMGGAATFFSVMSVMEERFSYGIYGNLSVAGALSGAVIGIITGSVLVWLLGKRISAVVPTAGSAGSPLETHDKTARS